MPKLNHVPKLNSVYIFILFLTSILLNSNRQSTDTAEARLPASLSVKLSTHSGLTIYIHVLCYNTAVMEIIKGYRYTNKMT